ncbi:uncharacterized protein VTP21DRAFT_11726 [Calcarisporiella thermophila]|uniref:uncharacterized protein n=1 Tax=Calcarisporiella thermophila TaxID=911321 RepID=UPI003742CE1C
MADSSKDNHDHALELEGGCLCKRIRYRVSLPVSYNECDPTPATYCHCSVCRKSTGALLPALTTVPVSAFTFLTPHRPKYYSSSPEVYRGFCEECGSQIYMWEREKDGANYGVYVGGFDDPDRIRVGRHIFWDSGVEQVKEVFALDPSRAKWREGMPSSNQRSFIEEETIPLRGPWCPMVDVGS